MRASRFPSPAVSHTPRDATDRAAGAYRVERYVVADAPEWDAFVRDSRNGTFLFERAFMDHHAARFEDGSLMVRDAASRLLAVLPANRQADALHSHGGLTYGGFVYGPPGRTLDASAILSAVAAHLRAHGIQRLHYKTMPAIYHRLPAEEDRVALFQAGASLVARQVLSVVPRHGRARWQSRRRRGVAAAAKAGIEVRESEDLATFWTLLGGVLRERHDAAPVHSLAEMEQLRERFPTRIRLFVATLVGDMHAGVLVFETDRVARAQYICADETGRDVGALDALFAWLLEQVFVDKLWFDFGSSHAVDGQALNAGLVAQKEGFGARTVVHDHYLLRLSP